MGHIPTREELKKAYAFYIGWNDNKRYEKSGKEPLSREEIEEEFEAGMKQIETSAKAEGYKIARETMQGSIDEAMREFGENVWKQCCESFSWALNNGPTNHAVQYVADTCPFKKKEDEL